MACVKTSKAASELLQVRKDGRGAAVIENADESWVMPFVGQHVAREEHGRPFVGPYEREK
jgi:hypothetical protein